MKHITDSLFTIFDGVFEESGPRSGGFSGTIVHAGTRSKIHYAVEYHEDERGLIAYSNLENFCFRLLPDELATMTVAEIIHDLRAKIAVHFLTRAKSFL